MKKIERIQSISDIITNSSSEVFIVKGIPEFSSQGEESGCITIDPITPSWIQTYIKWEDDAIAIALDNLGYEGANLVRMYPETKDTIEKALDGFYFIDIEDHYDYDSYTDDVDSAKWNCIYYDYRH